MALTETSNAVTFEAAIEHLKAQRPGMPYLPVGITEGITRLLCPGRWSVAAKSCHDHGRALTLYIELFPNDRFLLSFGITRPDQPLWGFAVYPPFPPGDEMLPPIFTTHHHICSVAIMLAALERKRRG